MLKLGLGKVKEFGVENVLVTCDKDNIGSAKTITKNGEKLVEEVEIDCVTVQRYEIE